MTLAKDLAKLGVDPVTAAALCWNVTGGTEHRPDRLDETSADHVWLDATMLPTCPRWHARLLEVCGG